MERRNVGSLRRQAPNDHMPRRTVPSGTAKERGNDIQGTHNTCKPDKPAKASAGKLVSALLLSLLM